jgi:aspartate aminotransferase-like enzyme/GNAT superfamily N-acetyltransferase
VAEDRLVYKVASEAREFEQIHALNYRTFVEEIPQHAANPAGSLVDRFHAENTYVICRSGDAIAGMVALRGRRPFSLDEKLADLDTYLPANRRLCEIRLLAVAPKYRKTSVFTGLVVRLVQLARERGYDLALISGTVRQLRLYGHLGFEPFGPRVGSAEAQYQPMMLTLERFRERAAWLLGSEEGDATGLSLLPGPVPVAPRVREQLAAEPVSHRAPVFTRSLAEVRRELCALTGASHAAVLLGSGTLANDVVAGQLSQAGGKGLVLSNGEFGERLIDHAARAQLDFEVYRRDWAKPFDLAALARRLEARPRWLWFCHCETSTGMLNDLDAIASLCRAAGTELCVDAISSIGTVPLDLREASFATAVSGKGLRSYPGLAIVFHRRPAMPSANCPRYLDLGLYCADEVPFTHSSNLVAALAASLSGVGAERYDALARDSRLLRRLLEESGLKCLVPAQYASPAVVTLALGRDVSSSEVARRMAETGYALAYNSAYLLQRNWIQLALMGDYRPARFPELVAGLREAVRGSAETTADSSGSVPELEVRREKARHAVS